MACNITLGTLPGVLSAKRQHVTAVTTPVGSQVCERFEAMRNSVVDLLLVPISSVGLRYTFCDHLLITLLVAGIPAVLALVPKGVE